jgi:HEAT repeat protein
MKVWACVLACGICLAAEKAVDPWDVLRKGLADSDPEHRRQAVLAVAAIGPTTEALTTIENALQDKSAMVRQTAAAALGQLKAPQSIPFLKQALNDTGEVAFAAAKALWDMGDSSGREVLQEVLIGTESTGPGLVHDAMRKARHKMHNPSELALMGINEASGALLGPASMGILVIEEVKKQGGAVGRALAASLLTQHPDNYTPVLLDWALDDKNWMVRAAVAKGLGECGTAEKIPKLQKLLNDDRAAVRYLAAASVIRLSAKPPQPVTSGAQ